MAHHCLKCKKRFESEHDGSIYFDQETNEPLFACHDCLILSVRSRRPWLLKGYIQLKTQAMEKKSNKGH